MEGIAAGTAGFREARRVLGGATARLEKLLLLWLAARVPARITSDHLTLVGFAAAAGCGALYAASARHPSLLLLANLALVLNWLGDSLDGTLARHRRCERPRFGFYVDHLLDAFGAVLVLGGLALSGLMSPLVAAALLVAYLLLAVETYLATYALGCFKISWGPVGGTELRLGLVALNTAAFLWPQVALGGRQWLLFDLVALPAAAALALLTLVAGVRATRALVRAEGWAPRKALCVAVGCLVVSGSVRPAHAGEAGFPAIGSRVRVHFQATKRVGLLAALDEKTLTVASEGGGESNVVARADVSRLEWSVKPSRKKKGAVIGLAAGFGAGLAGTFALCNAFGTYCPADEGLGFGLLYGAGLGAFGATVGALVAPGERWAEVPMGALGAVGGWRQSPAPVHLTIVPLLGHRLGLSVVGSFR